MRRMLSPCCPRAASGHAAAAPRSVMNSRRLMPSMGVSYEADLNRFRSRGRRQSPPISTRRIAPRRSRKQPAAMRNFRSLDRPVLGPLRGHNLKEARCAGAAKLLPSRRDRNRNARGTHDGWRKVPRFPRKDRRRRDMRRSRGADQCARDSEPGDAPSFVEMVSGRCHRCY
jgi:hypothetical protein